MAYAAKKDTVYYRDAYACASQKYRINIGVYTEHPWQSMFVYNMFLRPDGKDHQNLLTDEWTIYAFPGCTAEPAKDGTRQENFSIMRYLPPGHERSKIKYGFFFKSFLNRFATFAADKGVLAKAG